MYAAPGEVHWHGATPEDFMEHFAMLESAANRAETATWFEHVTDEDYFRTVWQMRSSMDPGPPMGGLRCLLRFL